MADEESTALYCGVTVARQRGIAISIGRGTRGWVGELSVPEALEIARKLLLAVEKTYNGRPEE